MAGGTRSGVEVAVSVESGVGVEENSWEGVTSGDSTEADVSAPEAGFGVSDRGISPLPKSAQPENNSMQTRNTANVQLNFFITLFISLSYICRLSTNGLFLFGVTDLIHIARRDNTGWQRDNCNADE